MIISVKMREYRLRYHLAALERTGAMRQGTAHLPRSEEMNCPANEGGTNVCDR